MQHGTRWAAVKNPNWTVDIIKVEDDYVYYQPVAGTSGRDGSMAVATFAAQYQMVETV